MNDTNNNNPVSLQIERDKLIRKLDSFPTKTDGEVQYADALFSSGLTMYSRSYSFNSIFYNSFTKSVLDPNISLHPDQLKVIKLIHENRAAIISAPTSFGKTFCVFEYIARFHPKNVVLVVPTLALAKEYLITVVKKFPNEFHYNVYTGIDGETDYNFLESNLFILTHDRVVSNSNFSKLRVIDFLAIDEVYKLENNGVDNRTLILNVAYFELSKISEKYVLLAPFIAGVKNKDQLEKTPVFMSSDYSPVVNDVSVRESAIESDRFPTAYRLIKGETKEKKTLVYFPSPTNIKTFIKKYIDDEEIVGQESKYVDDFLDWARKEIHPDWDVVKALERGYLIHYGTIPQGVRDFLLSLFNDPESGFTHLLCTSTLLEGVNTAAEYLIIVKANRISMDRRGSKFSPFDFYNLIGRTGRLFQYFVGKTYYINS